MYVSVLEGGLGGVLGVDGGWLPLPTRPQRDCDPASLVLLCPVLIGGGGGYMKIIVFKVMERDESHL